jgi:hypothetical protein
MDNYVLCTVFTILECSCSLPVFSIPKFALLVFLFWCYTCTYILILLTNPDIPLLLAFIRKERATGKGIPGLDLCTNVPDLDVSESFLEIDLCAGFPYLDLCAGIPDLDLCECVPDIDMCASFPALISASVSEVDLYPVFRNVVTLTCL